MMVLGVRRLSRRRTRTSFENLDLDGRFPPVSPPQVTNPALPTKIDSSLGSADDPDDGHLGAAEQHPEFRV